jgi:Tfp pilus assembly protein PilE
MRTAVKAYRAFTMVELLFVVATIAILAAISVPNFLEAQIRAKVSRAHADMATLEQGLRRYYADYNVYPQHRPEVHQFLEACSRLETVDGQTLAEPAEARYSWTGDDPQASTRAGNSEDLITWYHNGGRDGNRSAGFPILIPASQDLSVLTTPIAYIGGQLFADPFADIKGQPYTYVNLSELQTSATAFTAQPGPFRRYVLLSYGPDTDSSCPYFVNPVRGPWIHYDPTNGTVSKGDILAFGNGDAKQTSSPLDLAPLPESNRGYMGGDIAI